MLRLTVKEKSALYAAYMPFVKGGGLFIPNPSREYHLGEEVFIVLTLIEDTDQLPVSGRIVWITPRGADGNRQHGIGVQFHDQDGGLARNRIETLLAGMLQSDRPTHTM